MVNLRRDMIKPTIFSLYNNLQSIRDQYAAVLNIDPESLSDKNMTISESPLEFIPIFAYRESHKCHGYISIPNLSPCDGAGHRQHVSSNKTGRYRMLQNGKSHQSYTLEEVYILYIAIEGEEFLTIKNLNKSELGEDYTLYEL